MPHIAVARLWFEGNSFSPTPTDAAALRSREWVAGPAALEAYAGTATELGGLAAFLAARPAWRATILRCTSAQPGGPLTREAFEGWLAEVEQGLRDGAPWDGVYLSLHGACVAADEPAADLAIIRRVRALVGPDTPLTASFDFHGNMAAEIATLLDGASVYRSYPHLDMDATAARALALLERRMAGERLHGAIAKLPRVLHSFHMRSAGGPMAEVWAVAAALESPDVPEAAPFGGFSWGDTPHAGPSGMAWATTPDAARQAAAAVRDAIATRLPRFAVELPGPEAALATALAAPPGLVALLDPADNPLSGGVADTPDLLRVLLQAGPPVPTVFAFLHDPDTVAEAAAAGPGASLAVRLGGRSTPAFGPPVSAQAVVERLTEGRFTNEGPMERGAPVDLGATAVLRLSPTLRVILTSRKEAAVDPGFFALHGIDLSRTRLLANKAKNHFRAAYAERCAAIVECDCPGPAALDLAGLPFRHVPVSWRVRI
ncbi:M81 family metallopeptidase [Falsiroseomonas selenitidurans]|uniref:Microcystinase C n=1 Tax=Falsiroseomonas selenitidurans TaxID=2716335 RepID=A0ABX1E0W4_9PROT|nr:M81 family metallopeptidase [Falsiroseomonas selenitidurans]NKC30696.1 M81 family metallopeptidase [Falsiroseomonas selenitidurans]